jgi:predicted metal-binding protein
LNRVKSAAENFFDDIQHIPLASLCQSEAIKQMCASNTCGSFGKNWTCPPADRTVDTFRSKMYQFDTFMVFYKVYEPGSSFDWKGTMLACSDFQRRLRKLNTRLKTIEPKPEFLILGAGCCQMCRFCSSGIGEHCLEPEEAIVSFETCGIDVMKMMKDNGLNYDNDPSTVTYIGAVCHLQQSVIVLSLSGGIMVGNRQPSYR